MEISKLKTLTTPDLNDVLPILDINGGLSGKPILRKAILLSLLSLAGTADGGNNSNGFAVPTIIKTVAESADYFIGISMDGTPYKISKANLLAGLSSGSSASSGGSGGSDTYFSNVKLLLRCGVLNSQTISDVSNSQNIITAYGNATVSSGYFSNSKGIIFDGSGDYLLSPASNDFSLGDGDFTIEAFIKPTSLTSVYGRQILGTYLNNAGDFGWILYLNPSTGNLSFFVGSSSGGSLISLTGSTAPTVNVWNYIAVKRSSGLVTLTLDGAIIASANNNFNDAYSRLLKIGTQESVNIALGDSRTSFMGVIDENIRITKNIARDVSIIPTTSFQIS